MALTQTFGRDALLAQLIGFLFAFGAMFATSVFANDVHAGFVISLSCGAAALVMCTWSLVLALRAVHAREGWKTPALILSLGMLELSIPSVLLWYDLVLTRATADSLLHWIGAPVLFPCIAVASVAGLIVILVTRKPQPAPSPWRRMALISYGAMLATFAFVIVPGATFLMAALNRNTHCPWQWPRVVVDWTPDFIATNVDRYCANSNADRFRECHRILVAKSMLPADRLIEVLREDDRQVVFPALRELKLYRRKLTGVCIAVSEGKPVASEIAHAELGAWLGSRGTYDQLAPILNDPDTVPPQFMNSLLAALPIENQSVSVLNLLARAVLTGRLRSPNARKSLRDFSASYVQYRKLDEENALSQKSEIYQCLHGFVLDDEPLDCAYQWPQRVNDLRRMLFRCESGRIGVRRMAIFALGNALSVEVRATPYEDFSPSNESPAVSSNETEEWAKIIAKGGAVEAWILSNALTDKAAACDAAWEWLADSHPASALEVGLRLAYRKAETNVEIEQLAGRFLAEHGTDEQILKLLKKPFEPEHLYRNLLIGLGRCQRQAFCSELEEIRTKHPAFAEPALAGLSQMDSRANTERRFSSLMDGDEEAVLVCARNVKFVLNPDLRVALALRLLESRDALTRWTTIVNALQNIEPSSFYRGYAGQIDDASPYWVWVRQMCKLLNDEDVVIRRGAALSLTRLPIMNHTALRSPEAVAEGEWSIWFYGQPAPETKVEIDEREVLQLAVREWLLNHKKLPADVPPTQPTAAERRTSAAR